MINVNMTEKAGVTLATAGKYCADNVKVTPSAEILRKDEQAKSATPTETAQDITPDSGKVLSKVSVGAIPKTYVGSGVTKKAADTVSPSTSEQTVCASGVYTTGAQKVSAITPSIVGNLDASSFASSIVAAVEGKGVTVPDGTLLDGMASLIESIEAGGGGGVEPFTKIISGTITFAERTTAFQLPETENFLAAYFIRTDFWGVKKDIFDNGAQVALFASGQSFGYFSPIYMSSTLFQYRDELIVDNFSPELSDGKIMFNAIRTSFFYGTYYYSLIYGTK